MNAVVLGAGLLAALGGITYYNYRRMMPKPIALATPEYPVRVQTIPVEVQGQRLYGELLTPEGKPGPLPTVICCHGFGSSYRQCAQSIGISLAKAGINAFCFDFRGGGEHSKSDGAMTEMSIFTEKQDLEAVIQQVLRQDCVDGKNLFLLGQSQGGCVAAMTAPGYKQQIRGLILEYPAFCIPDDARRRFSTPEEIPEIVNNHRHKVGKAYYEKLLDYDVYEAIQGYDGPVLILHGDQDAMVPASYSQKAAAIYENAEFRLLPGEVHGFTGKGKQTAAKEIYTFLLMNQQ